MKKCKNCKYWSEMMAMTDHEGMLTAYCLNDGSPHAYSYTREAKSCDKWADGTAGAIDAPGNL